MELWQQIVAGLVVALVVAIVTLVFTRVFSSPERPPTGNTAAVSESPTTTSAPAATSTPAAAASGSAAPSTSCAITPSSVARIYEAPDVSGANTSVPVASYPVIKREAVPFGGGSDEWYEIRVQGSLAWIIDMPGQIDANSCGPL